MDRPICDACRVAPSSSYAACTSTQVSCSLAQCSWLLDSENTLGIVWGGARGATRGWGNSFSYVRNLHDVAAMLGRRLLIHLDNAYLPTEELYLGGERPWALGSVDEYLRQPSARSVQEDEARAAVSPTGFKAYEHSPNRTSIKWALVRYLSTLNERHLWLNFSRSAQYILAKAAVCPRVKHAPVFSNCIGRLLVTPRSSSKLAMRKAEVAASLERLGIAANDSARPHGRYLGVHIRTFGADMGVPAGATPDPDAALEFLAWEVQVNASEYAHAIRRLCRNGSYPIYVASDARAAVRLWQNLCPGRVLHQHAAATVHSERMSRGGVRTVGSGGNRTGGGFLLDWLTLASAHAIVRWGAQHSSFATSARLASCSTKQWRSPKNWQYKAATSWLLGKLRFHAAKARHVPGYDCNATISPMLRTIAPCRSGCVTECRDKVYGAFT